MRFSYRGYLKETRRPIYSAVLLLPFFLVYHIGTVFFRTTYINGADALIIRFLSALSVHSMFASALVLLLCFVMWQLKTRASWQVDTTKVTLLFLESVCFALLLYFAFGWISLHLSLARTGGAGPVQKLVLYCGAGIYEELVFRAFLLGILLIVFRRAIGLNKHWAAVWATALAALLFSIFHYVGPGADRLTLSSFLQRVFGGLYFSLLFVTRGFGVTASAHALYDIVVGLTQ